MKEQRAILVKEFERLEENGWYFLLDESNFRRGDREVAIDYLKKRHGGIETTCKDIILTEKWKVYLWWGGSQSRVCSYYMSDVNNNIYGVRHKYQPFLDFLKNENLTAAKTIIRMVGFWQYCDDWWLDCNLIRLVKAFLY